MCPPDFATLASAVIAAPTGEDFDTLPSDLPEDIATMGFEELSSERDRLLGRQRIELLPTEELRRFAAISSRLRTLSSTSRAPAPKAKKAPKLTSVDDL